MIEDWVQVPSELNRYKRIRSTFDIDSAVLYEPIPLTPDILEIVRYSANDILHHNEIVLKFVHQLQHALRLFGIDKEIEL